MIRCHSGCHTTLLSNTLCQYIQCPKVKKNSHEWMCSIYAALNVIFNCILNFEQLWRSFISRYAKRRNQHRPKLPFDEPAVSICFLLSCTCYTGEHHAYSGASLYRLNRLNGGKFFMTTKLRRSLLLSEG